MASTSLKSVFIGSILALTDCIDGKVTDVHSDKTSF